jgi:hypothetical protein
MQEELTVQKSLKEQLLDRIALARNNAARPTVVERETDEEHFHRVYNDPDAWTTISRNKMSILPS